MKHIIRDFISPGLSCLPKEMATVEAVAMLFAIGMQESRFEHRFQTGGPAHGFWQFEQAGIEGVLNHHASAEHIRNVCDSLVIRTNLNECHEAVAFNDSLACCFARLLLWTLPGALPKMGEYQKGWDQYIAAWRPGKPREESWKSYFNTAWLSV